MSRPTDRQLLEEMHGRICNPVLFPQVEPIVLEHGPLFPSPYRFQAPVNIARAPGFLLLEVETVDQLSLRFRWRYDNLVSRDFFVQLFRGVLDG